MQDWGKIKEKERKRESARESEWNCMSGRKR